MKNNGFGIAGACLGALAVVLGAMGAHALKKVLNPEELASFETGVKFLMYGSIQLLVIFLFEHTSSTKFNSKYFHTAGNLVLLGTSLFSFSIFILSTRYITGLGDGLVKIIGPVTPIGGLLIIAGWVFLGMSFVKRSEKNINND